MSHFNQKCEHCTCNILFEIQARQMCPTSIRHVFNHHCPNNISIKTNDNNAQKHDRQTQNMKHDRQTQNQAPQSENQNLSFNDSSNADHDPETSARNRREHRTNHAGGHGLQIYELAFVMGWFRCPCQELCDIFCHLCAGTGFSSLSSSSFFMSLRASSARFSSFSRRTISP